MIVYNWQLLSVTLSNPVQNIHTRESLAHSKEWMEDILGYTFWGNLSNRLQGWALADLRTTKIEYLGMQVGAYLVI